MLTPVPVKSPLMVTVSPPDSVMLTSSTSETVAVLPALSVIVKLPAPAVRVRLWPLGRDLQRVGFAVTVDRVVAVAGVPHDRVIAGVSVNDIGAAEALDEIVSAGAVQRIPPLLRPQVRRHRLNR